MKAIILIISVIISIIGLIAGQFLSPLIASWLDTNPWFVAIIGGGLLFGIITLVTFVLTKDKFIRGSILIPIFVGSLATVGLVGIRFGTFSYYRNGYCCFFGDLRNSLGINFIKSFSRNWYKGINEFGQEIFFNVYEGTGYDYNIEVYDKYGNFIGRKRLTLDFDDKLKKIEFKDLDARNEHLFEKYTGITVHQQIG